ncbi:MAG: PIN domain-containing protein [Candidatus Binataceae bacterium]
MKAALDTNILVYAEGLDGPAMRDTALALIVGLGPDRTVLPVQALGDLFNVLVRKGGHTAGSARKKVFAWTDVAATIDTSFATLMAAVDLAEDHKFRIWDAIIMAATAEAGCRLLLSEDLHEGFTWRGVTVVNPFSPKRNALLDALLAAGTGN